MPEKLVTDNLIEYDVIMDTDLAIVLTMLSKIKNTDMLSDEVKTLTKSPSALKNLLLFREDKNPLSVILNDKYKDSLGNILKELETECEDDIIKNTRPNDILIFVATMQMNKNLIHNKILCKTEKEVERIKKFLGADIDATSEKISDLSKYDCVFLKYIDNIYNYTGIEAKHLYIYNAKFNLGENFRMSDIAIILSRTNNIRTIDPYKNLRVPNLEADNND